MGVCDDKPSVCRLLQPRGVGSRPSELEALLPVSLCAYEIWPRCVVCV